MKTALSFIVIVLFMTLINISFSANLTKDNKNTLPNLMKKEQHMASISATAIGTFEVNLDIAKEDTAPVGRMIINKQYQGDLVGTGVGQMISKRTKNGSAVYYAIEEFTGEIQGKKGNFTLLHHGSIQQGEQTLTIKIMAGSGDGELKTISGSMKIIQTTDKHTYELNYTL